jgi:hypothetical protein
MVAIFRNDSRGDEAGRGNAPHLQRPATTPQPAWPAPHPRSRSTHRPAVAPPATMQAAVPLPARSPPPPAGAGHPPSRPCAPCAAAAPTSQTSGSSPRTPSQTRSPTSRSAQTRPTTPLALPGCPHTPKDVRLDNLRWFHKCRSLHHYDTYDYLLPTVRGMTLSVGLHLRNLHLSQLTPTARQHKARGAMLVAYAGAPST